jgi:hypothetical protein
MARFDRLDATVDDNLQTGSRRLQAIDASVIQRRNFPVLLRRQTMQPGLARVHDEGLATSAAHRIDEPLEVGFAILIVNADAALHRHRNVHRGLHGRDARRNQRRLRHKTGAEAALLHPVRRTSDIEIDFVVATRGADRGRIGQLSGIRAAKLKRNGMLVVREPEQAVAIAVDHGIRRHHLGIEKRVASQQPMEGPAMAVRPIHHGGHTKSTAWTAHTSFRYAGMMRPIVDGSVSAK